MIVFGETGAGKSSVINMLDGGKVAPVSNGAAGMTFACDRYEKKIGDQTFNIFDTAGLNEGDAGKVQGKTAITNLYKCIYNLETGVSLLIYVMRAPRIKDTAQKNFKMFFETFCNKEVPIVIIVTGLEDEEGDMDAWWRANKTHFAANGMHFSGQACITATKGKQRKGIHIFQQEYDDSKTKVEALIPKSCLSEPWKMPRSTWFNRVATVVVGMFGGRVYDPVSLLVEVLVEHAGMSTSAARQEAKTIHITASKPQPRRRRSARGS